MKVKALDAFLLLLIHRARGQCSLCFDGSPPPEPSFIPGGELGDVSCGALALAAIDPTAQNCAPWISLGLQCGCPVPTGGCPLCYDGSLPPDFQKEVINATCGVLLSAAGQSDQAEDTSCAQWLQVGLLCDCPVPTEACTICEDGAGIPNPTQKLGEDACSDIAVLPSFAQEDECTAWQATAGTYCGCDNPIASQEYCRICGGDTLLPDPGLEVLASSDGFPLSCAQLEFNQQGLPCSEVQNRYGELCCGCPLCHDSSVPPDLSFIPSGLPPGFEGMTCGDLYEASKLPSSDTPCLIWRQIGVFCGCPLAEDACSLCEDQRPISDPDLVIGSRSCGEMAGLASIASGQQCTAFQATVGEFCGCDNPIASNGYCRICGGDTLLPDPTRTVDDAASITCAELELNLDGTLSCDQLQSTYSDTCCDGPSESPTERPSDNSEKPSNNSEKPSDNSEKPSESPSLRPTSGPSIQQLPTDEIPPTGEAPVAENSPVEIAPQKDSPTGKPIAPSSPTLSLQPFYITFLCGVFVVSIVHVRL